MAKKPVPPKGGVKGGARFPRHSLQSCVNWAQKLVSKTHNGPQPEDVILAGVVETKGPNGKVKISAMKQFGLIDGDATAYIASNLAKSLVNSPEDERLKHLQKSVLLPTLFKPVFDTFQGDETSFAKVRHRFTDLNVHPDNADGCVKIYSQSLEFAGLGSIHGDVLHHISAINLKSADDDQPIEEQDASSGDEDDDDADLSQKEQIADRRTGTLKGKSAVQINLTVDSSLDTDKLEKQLKLLRKYGAL